MSDLIPSITRRTLLVGSAAAATSWPGFVLAATAQGIAAGVNSQAMGPLLPSKLYGGFIEHIGNLINHSLWSEMLDDRKFYYGVIEKPEVKPTHPLAALSFNQKWLAVGPLAAIQLDTQNVWVGQHSPVITANEEKPVGIAQPEIALKADAEYNGRIVAWAESGVDLVVKLTWGEGPGQSLEQKIATSKKWQTRKFTFKPGVATRNARFEILARGKGRCGIGP